MLRGEVVALVTNFLILLRHPFFAHFVAHLVWGMPTKIFSENFIMVTGIVMFRVV